MFQLVNFNLTRLVCDENQLSRLLIVPPEDTTSAAEVSSALCAIEEQLIPEVTDTLLQQLNVSAIAELVSSRRVLKGLFI